jgi:hypothetical protein
MNKLLLVLAAAVSVSMQAAPARVPVVVELFTSEGCSSCPPADTVLSRLAGEQPIAGVEVVPLGFHVTYWDQLGWKDAASLPEATARQQDYSRVFGEDRVYTPQAIVDGRDELVGSDETALRRAITRAAAQPHARVTLSARLASPDLIVATATVDAVPAGVTEKLRTIFVLTEDGVTSVVKRGENGGRTLRHDAVVRRVSSTGEIRGIAAWPRERLHQAAFVQGERSRHVLGAATVSIR